MELNKDDLAGLIDQVGGIDGDKKRQLLAAFDQRSKGGKRPRKGTGHGAPAQDTTPTPTL